MQFAIFFLLLILSLSGSLYPSLFGGFSVPYREPPQYNPRRRRYSDIYGTSMVTSPSTNSNMDSVHLPPSPSLSNRSVPPYSYASSSMSETSSGSSTQPSVGEDCVSIITGNIRSISLLGS